MSVWSEGVNLKIVFILDLESFSPFLGSSTCSKSEIKENIFHNLLAIVDNDEENEEEGELGQKDEEVEEVIVEVITANVTNEELDDEEKAKHVTAAFKVYLDMVCTFSPHDILN